MNLHEDILFYAFRYTLGRMTYSVDTVAREVIQHADEIDPRTRDLMISGIEEAISKGRAGMDMDAAQWGKVRDTLVKANKAS